MQGRHEGKEGRHRQGQCQFILKPAQAPVGSKGDEGRSPDQAHGAGLSRHDGAGDESRRDPTAAEVVVLGRPLTKHEDAADPDDEEKISAQDKPVDDGHDRPAGETRVEGSRSGKDPLRRPHFTVH